ncbi:T9SS type B sorting domain-containing protein [Bizionia sediminis]|uniref:T9SS type B sorting domain-containing protein n=1 Tax=Bizionia sediminis TaxID=1737064 RepID=A0ABW5KQI3_9FLAO
MKLFSLIVTFGLACYASFSQTTAIPDSNFEQTLINQGIDTNGLNGNILNTEAQAVTSLNLGDNGILDITGIQAFFNITDLNLGANQIANVNLSGLTQLLSLRIESNDVLASLNVSQSSLLETVYMASIPSLPGMPPVSVMDFSQNTNLTSIEIRWFNDVANFIMPVTNTLTTVNIRALGDATLDFSALDNLEDLQIRGSSVSTAITLPNVYTNLRFLNLTSINIPTIDISNYVNLERIYFLGTYVENLLLPNSTTLVDVYILLHNLQVPLDFSVIPNVTDIDISSNQTTPLVVDLTQNFLLEDLDLSNNDLLTLDISQNSVLEELNVSSNNLTALDVTQNPLLVRINANFNQLPSIDLTQNSQLEYLNLRNNVLPSLDVTQNTNLRSIDISNNLFTGTGLDLTQNANLNSINAAFNQIASLDISQNAVLSNLILNNNLFSGTDIMDQFYTIRANNNGIFGANLILSHNRLTGNMPDFASLIALNLGTPIGFSLAFDNNYFEFGHFENQHASFINFENTFGPPPYWDTFPNMRDYWYAPQAKVDTIDTLTVNAGDPLTLTTACAGTQNHYVWFKNGVPIPGAPDAASFTIPAVTSCDAAVYHAEIRSDLVPFENTNPPGTDNKNLLLVRNDITVIVTAPVESCVNILSPINGSIGVPVNETFLWESHAGACGYFVSIGTTPGGTDILNAVDVGNVTSYNLGSNLPANTVIYITVTPYFSSGVVLYCNEISFTTSSTVNPTTCTALSTPASGAINVPVTTTLSWLPSPYATGYILSMGSTPGGTDIVNALDLGDTTVYNPPSNLPVGSVIYVTISPYNSLGVTNTCIEENFTTEGLTPNCTQLLVPSNGSTDVLVGTNLSWDAVATATGYMLTVGTTPGGSELVNSLDVGATTTYNFTSNLPENTTIYVSITPYNAAGSAVGCTEESFTTQLLAPNCTQLLVPSNGSTDVLVGTNLSWDAVATATGYMVTVGTTPGGSELVNSLDVGATTTYNFTSDLPENTTIYASITPYNAAGSAVGCTEESFTTQLLAPNCTQLLAPSNGSTNVLVGTNLSWDAVATATGYMVTVGTTPGGSELVNSLDVGATTTYNFTSDLPENTTIYVSITPYNAAGSAVGCTEESFTTQILVPNCTQLLAPSNGSTDVLVGTNLSWDAVATATGYMLTVGTTTGGSELVNSLDVGATTTYNFTSDLPENTTIYVSITPYNAAGSAVGCTEESFTTQILVPNCTQLLAPSNGSTDVLVGTNLSWDAVATATGYMLTVGTTPGGSELVNSLDVGATTTYNFTNNLPENTTIYVSITPYNAAGSAVGCTEELFTTQLLVPNCTQLLAPSNGSTDVLVGTNLSWNAVTTATGYMLTVGTTPGGSELVTSLDVGATTTYNFTSNLPENTTIYVRITPYNAAGSAVGCVEESFTTQLFIPNCPFLVSPQANAQNVMENAPLVWTPVSNATGYLVSVGTSVGSSNLIFNEDVGLSTTFYPTSNWPEGETLYISITPYNETGSNTACLNLQITIREQNLKTPLFFTPNGDGQNDTWFVSDTKNQIKRISIFNRYGTLIKQLNHRSERWDGTYKGQPAPTSDYWYLIELHSGKQVTGHFTLKR